MKIQLRFFKTIGRFIKNRFKAILCILFVIFWSPYMLNRLYWSSNVVSIQALPNADVAVIFGTLIREPGSVSPLLQERLEAGIFAYEEQKVDKIVVSNTQSAAITMKNYLLEQGIPEAAIQLDTTADITEDTCTYIRRNLAGEDVVLITQTFHIHRTLYLCNAQDVHGIGAAAETIDIFDVSQYSLWTRVTVRTKRYLREAALMWIALLTI